MLFRIGIELRIQPWKEKQILKMKPDFVIRQLTELKDILAG